jgi:hypothetical protein
VSHELDHAASTLRSVADALADRCISLLEGALGSTGEDRAAAVAEERRITKARRSIERAIALLEDSPDEQM